MATEVKFLDNSGLATYTGLVKKYINNEIGKMGHIEITAVDTLPTDGEAGVIYLVKKNTEGTNNARYEYIWTDGKWELIGETEVDLTGYATESFVTGTVATFKADVVDKEDYDADKATFAIKTDDNSFSGKNTFGITSFVSSPEKITALGDDAKIGIYITNSTLTRYEGTDYGFFSLMFPPKNGRISATIATTDDVPTVMVMTEDDITEVFNKTAAAT